MSSPTWSVRRILSPLLALVLLSTGATVPLLDRHVEEAPSLRQMDEHPETAPPHDHSICIQLAANQGLASSAARVRLPDAPLVGLAEGGAARVADEAFTNGYHSRAPPVA